MASIVYCIATLDTKGEELNYLTNHLRKCFNCFLQPPHHIKIVAIDVSTSHETPSKTNLEEVVSGEEIIKYHPEDKHRDFSSLPTERGHANSIMSTALENFIKTSLSNDNVVGAIGLGGSGGTTMICPALQILPVGVPKVMVSTVASGNTSPYVGTSDIIMIPSVVDIAGLNSISMTILSNAAAAFAGMVAGKCLKLGYSIKDEKKPSVGITMFGVTTPCVTGVREKLEQRGYEVLVFHATGTGGKAMENLVSQGYLQAVLDITTTEVADYIVGGVMACNEERFLPSLQKNIPMVVSFGALDMVNFGSKDTVPSQFSERNLYVHNSQVTLMRTTVEENKQFSKFIAERLNQSSAPVRILFPEKGISALDEENMPFYCPEATKALLEEFTNNIHQTSSRQLKVLPYNINDSQFSNAIVEAFLEIAPSPEHKEVSTTSIKKSFVHPPAIRKDAKPETVEARESILKNLREQISKGIPIIGAGAGTGISAKFEEEGGVDLIVIYNSGRFRMAGRGSLAGLLPFKDANAVVLDMANEVLPVVKKTPVLAGVCATDPFRQMSRFLHELEQAGFIGVQNFPTVGLFDGNFRQNLEETGMGFGLEVEMIREAHEMGLLTTPYAFNEGESRALAEAGADIIVAHMGLTTSGSIGANTALSLDDSVEVVQKIANAAHKVNPEVIVLCHGGPIAGAEDAEYVLKRTKDVHGFYGASSMERLPVEKAIRDTARQYKSMCLN